MPLVLHHTGDLGDVIYALPTVRALAREHGPVRLILTPGHGTRELMGERRAQLILPLLRWQPYIEQADWHPTPLGFSLSAWRPHYHPAKNLADCHCRMFGFTATTECATPWLTVDRPKWVQAKRIYPLIIHRSPRYHGTFDWARLIGEYAGEVGMIGAPSEHAAFCAKFGPVPYVPTQDLLEAAQVIAGADVVAANQSVGAAMAIGMGVPYRMERWYPGEANCDFDVPWNHTATVAH